MVLYTSHYLRELLKEKGLPFSKVSVLAYEKAGILPVPENMLIYRKEMRWGKNTIRVYSEEEMKRLVEIVADYISKRNAMYGKKS